MGLVFIWDDRTDKILDPSPHDRKIKRNYNYCQERKESAKNTNHKTKSGTGRCLQITGKTIQQILDLAEKINKTTSGSLLGFFQGSRNSVNKIRKIFNQLIDFTGHKRHYQRNEKSYQDEN